MPSEEPNTCKRAAAATLHQPHHTTTAASDPDNGASRWICLLGCVSMQCRYALTSPLTAYPGLAIHWSHISDDIFTIICILRLSQAPKAAPPTVCWPTDCGHRHSTDPFTDYIMVRLRPRSVGKLPFRLSANPFSFAILVHLDNVQALSPGPRIASQRSKLSIPKGRVSGFAFTPPTHNTHKFAYQSRRHNTQRHVEVCEANDANQGSI